MSPVGGAAAISCMPAATMVIGSLLMFKVHVQPKFEAAMQNLAAGILLAAVGLELLPIIDEPKPTDNLAEAMGVIAGWIAAMIVMYGVKYLTEKVEGEESDEEGNNEAEGKQIVDKDLEQQGGRRGRTPGVPWGLVCAVNIDAFVDGFLVGLAYIARPHSGVVIGAATSIEMAFLGLSFAGILKECLPARKAVPLALLPPLLLVSAGTIGAAIGDVVKGSPPVFYAFMSFGTVALLFLVVEELLIEAHENQDGKGIWYINQCVFLGFLVIMVVEKLWNDE